MKEEEYWLTRADDIIRIAKGMKELQKIIDKNKKKKKRGKKVKKGEPFVYKYRIYSELKRYTYILRNNLASKKSLENIKKQVKFFEKVLNATEELNK